jgi:hypothetical protein
MLCTQPSVCQNNVATKVLLVLGTNSTSSLNSYTHTRAETTREPAVWRGGETRYGRRLDRLHLVTVNSSETPLPSTKTPHSFTSRNLWSRPSWLSGNPGLGAIMFNLLATFNLFLRTIRLSLISFRDLTFSKIKQINHRSLMLHTY